MNTRKASKTVSIICLLVLSIGVTGTSINYQLFPWMMVSTAVFSGIMVFHLWFKENVNVSAWLLMVIFLSTMTRLVISKHSPGFMGIDPDRYATAMWNLITSGSIHAINLDFYNQVPLFLIHSSTTSIILNARLKIGLETYIYVFGILSPLIIAAILKKFDVDGGKIMTAALLSGLGLTGVRYTAVAPIAQTLAVALFLSLILSTAMFLNSKNRLIYPIIVVYVVALSFTHKIGTFVIVVVGAFYPIISALSTAFPLITQKMKIDDKCGSILHSLWRIRSLILFGTLFTILQWVFMSNFAQEVVIRIFQLNGGKLHVVENVSGANRVSDTVFHFVHRRLHALSLVPLAACLSIVVFIKRSHPYTNLILSAFASISVLVVVGIFAPSSLNPIRAYFFIELIAIAIVVLGLSYISAHEFKNNILNSAKKYIILVIIVSVVISQPFSAFFIPDTPGTQRVYLTKAEASAKSWDVHLEGSVFTDPFFAHEVPNPKQGQSANWRSGHELLFNNRLPRENNTYLALRSNIIWRLYYEYRGYWKISYDIEETADRRLNRVYHNGDAKIFKN